MNIKRLFAKIKRRSYHYRTYILPAILILLTLFVTYTLLVLFSVPRPPKLKSGAGNTLYTASNKIYTSTIGTKSGEPKVTFSVGDAQIGFVLAGSNKVTPTKSGNTAIFPDILPDTDLHYTTTPNGLKEEIILKKFDQTNSNIYLFDLLMGNIVPKQLTTGLIEPNFKDKAGNYRFHFEKPFAIDAKGNRTNNVLLQIAQDKQLPDKYSLKLIVDEGWLADPTRAYPVTIDPTVVHDTTAEFAAGTLNRLKDTGPGATATLETYFQPLTADRNTVGLWHMDEGSANQCTGGTNDICDSSSTGLNGAFAGSAAFTTSSLLGASATTFDDDSSDVVNFGSVTVPISQRAFTIETWVYPTLLDSAGQYTSVISKADQFFLSIGDTTTRGSIKVRFYQSGVGWATTHGTSADVVTTNQWHHIAVTYDYVFIIIYVDGKELYRSNADAGKLVATGNSNLYINGNLSGTPQGEGRIDEVRISNVARTPEEIKSAASRRPYSVYTSDVIDLGGSSSFVTTWNPLQWSEHGVGTGDGETLKSSTNLVAQWNFNETSGTTADNAEGTAALDGTLTNFASTGSQDAAAGTGWTANNKRWGAGALMLDGAASPNHDYVTIADNNSLDLSTDFTLETWVKISSNVSTNWVNFIGKRTASSINYTLQQNQPASKFRVLIYDGTNNPYVDSTTIYNLGQWYHVVGVRDTSADQLKIYINGKLENTATDTTTGTIINTGPLNFGYDGVNANYFNGVLDSTRLYSRALAPAEIMSNYQAGNIEFQTRVGSDASPDDGSWESWKPTTGETLIEGFENNEENTRVYELGFSAPGVNPTWAKKNNLAASNSDTSSTDGRIPLGTNTTGDDTHVQAPAILKDGSTYKMWYSGHDGTNLRIYYATSSDGLTWTKYNNAVPSNSDTSSTDGRIPLGTNGTGDDTHTAYPSVIKDGSTYKMWYMGSDGTNYRIYYATSSDGLTWTKYNNVIEAASNTTGTNGRIPLGSSGGDTNHTFRPTVIKDGSTYKMWYSGQDATNIRVYYATSSDGLTWTKYNNAVPSNSNTTSTDGRIPLGSSGADTTHTYNPMVIKDGSIYKMWYDGQDATNVRTLYATSHDGLTWMKYDNSVPSASNTTTTNGRLALGGTGTGDVTHTYSPSIIKDGATYKVWYAGYGSGVWRIYHASMTPIPLAQSTESLIKQESTYSEKFVTTPQADGSVVGLWHMDETGGTGAYLKDGSGNGNHGTPTGATLSNGIAGKARTFDGNNDYIDLGTGSTFDFGNNGSFTHSGWVNITTALNYAGFVSKVVAGRGGTYSYMTVVMADGSLAAYTGAAWVTPCPAGSVSTKKWNHLAFSYNGTNITGYVNGASCGSVAFTYTDNTAHNLYIGSWYSPSTIYDFNGQIDEVVTSKAARSAEEIAEEYRLGRDHYFNKTISSTDLSGKTTLPFYIAADRPGSYLTATIGESAYVNYQPDSNTIGLWHLDEKSGSGYYFKDSSGRHNLTGSTSAIKGKIGNAALFTSTAWNNNTRLYDSAASSDFDIGTGFTAEAWFYKSTSTADYEHRLVGNRYTWSDTSGWYITFPTNEALQFSVNSGSASTGIYSPVLATGNWYHVAGVYDNGTLRLYINGQLVSSATGASYASPNRALTIGGQPDSSNYGFNGPIDEVRISNTARTADEIRQTYEAGLRTHPITIDFASAISHSDPLSGSSDLTFTLMATPSGTTNAGDNIYEGDKIIVRENYDGTEYLAQGTVDSVNVSTGATTVSAWDGSSTFPTNGFGPNSTVFKWQREYWNINNETLDSHIDAITNLSLRLTDGAEGRTIYLDDLRSNGDYLTTPSGSTVTSTTGNRYLQYRAILSSFDEVVSATLSAVTVDYVINTAPATPSLDAPSDTATNQLLSPVLQTTTTDADSDYIRYKIELCENVGMTTNCQTFDQTSSQTGWSGQNAQTSTAYTSGTQASYTIQTPLAAATTYYWRSYAIDPAGTNTWSSTQGTPFSFTTTTAPSAPGTPWAEGATNPTGVIDTTPEFSAIHSDPDNDAAVYYEIEVNTNNTFTGTVLWDTGAVAMASLASGVRSTDVSYAGTAIPLDGAGTTYYWRIRFTDNKGAVSPFTTTQSFTMNASPTTPTLDAPSNVGSNIGLLPILQTTTTDADSDYLRYKIELCENVSMTTNCQTFDQTVSQTGWSGQNAQTNTAYTSGTQASYTISTKLTPNFTYYWRSYAIDSAGTNTWSSTQTPNSFTTHVVYESFECRIDESVDDTGLTILWNDRELEEDSYKLEKSTDGGAFAAYQTLAADSTSYQDTSISQGHTYQYRIAAFVNSGSTYGEWCTTNTLTLQASPFNFSGLNLNGLKLN